jgi:uncharacterized membrane protein YjfL (UPF0719 family)
MTETLINNDNKAAAVSLAGFLLGVIQVVIPVLTGPSHSFWADVKGVAAYGIGGIIAMAVAGVVFEQYSRWVGAPLREEIAAGNLSAGIIDGAIFFASSQIVAGALSGDGGSIVPTVVFWALGVVALIVFTHIFRSLTSYNDAESVKSNNVAAALGCAGLIIAIGIMAGYAVAGVPNEIMGEGPIPASKLALKKAGLKMDQMDVIESNEAFAAQAIAVARGLELDMKKTNPNGGAIALGHPIGCSGAFLATKAIYELQRTGGRYALVTMCIGGGQGIAAIFERVH